MKNNQLENQVREEIINYLKTNRPLDRVTEYEIDLSKYDENTLKIIDYYLRNVDTSHKVMIFTRQVIEDILGFTDISDDEMIKNFDELLTLFVKETYRDNNNPICSFYNIFSSFKTGEINRETTFILKGLQME